MHDGDILTAISPKPRILLVEDEALLRGHLARVLSDEYIVDTAGNGREALEVVMRAPPALVVANGGHDGSPDDAPGAFGG